MHCYVGLKLLTLAQSTGLVKKNKRNDVSWIDLKVSKLENVESDVFHMEARSMNDIIITQGLYKYTYRFYEIKFYD